MRKNKKLSLKLFIGSLSMASVSVMTVVITANQIGKQRESQKKIMDYSKGKKLQLAAPSVAPIMSTKPIMSAPAGNKITTPPNLVRTNKLLQSLTIHFDLMENPNGNTPKYTGIYLDQIENQDDFLTNRRLAYIKINEAARDKLRKLGIQTRYPVISKNNKELFGIQLKMMREILESTGEQILQIDSNHLVSEVPEKDRKFVRLLKKGDRYTAPLDDYNKSGVNSRSGANGALVKKMQALQDNIFTLEQWNKMINIYYDLKEIDDKAMVEINKNKTIFEKDKNVKNKEALKLMGEARHMDSEYNKFNYLTYDEMHSLRNKYKYLIRLLRDRFTLNEDQIESYINSEKRLVKWDEEFKKLMYKFGIATKKYKGRLWAHLLETSDYKNGFNFKIRNVDNFDSVSDKKYGRNLFLGTFDAKHMFGVKTHKTEVELAHYDPKIDSINWSMSLTGNTGNFETLFLKPRSFVGMNNLIKSLFSNGKSDAISKVFEEFGTKIKLKNIVKVLAPPVGNSKAKHTLFRIGIEKLEMSYKKDANLLGEEIKLAKKDLEECKQRLDGLDKKRENAAFNALQNLAVNDLGFIPTSGFGAPDLSFLQINVSRKREIDRYKSRLKSFNEDQIWLLNQAKQESKVHYTDDKANPYSDIKKTEINELDLLRKNIINFDTYSAFMEKFKQFKDYSELCQINRLKKAAIVKKVDLGFITKVNPPSNALGTNYTVNELMAYNRQMSNFNSAQSNQLSIARSLSNTKYSNAQINVHGYLGKKDATILNRKRDNIKNNQTNNEFLSCVKTVRRKGITLWLNKIKLRIDSNSFLNKFGFLQDNDINSTSNFYIALHKYENAINTTNADVMEERDLEKKLEHEVYKLQQKDSVTQINQIEALKSKPFNDLGFTPSQETINKKVKMPAIGYSTKTQIDAYANYVQVFNVEQEKLLLEAKEEAKTTYKNSNANVYGNLSSTGDQMKKLDTARNEIINKDTYNAFVSLFEVVKGIDKARDDFTRKNLTKPVDLFFTSTKGFEKPDDLPAIPSREQYKAYNKAMIDFNSDQFKQLIQAQTLAKTRYTDEVVNERHNLTIKELKDLQGKRNNINNAHDNNAFRNLFNTLRAKDLLISIEAIDKTGVNKFGYLTSSDFATLEGNIDALKNKIKKFITLKGKVQVYNQDMIAKIIKDSTYNADFIELMDKKFGLITLKDGWSQLFLKNTEHTPSIAAINFQINDHNESFFVGQKITGYDHGWGTGSVDTFNSELTVSKIKDFTDWKIKITGASNLTLFQENKNKAPVPFAPVNNLLKKILGKYTNNDDVERIDVTFKNISNVFHGDPNDTDTWFTQFKIMIKEIKITYRKDLSYYKSFDQDMLEVVKDLKEKDENAQTAAINSLKIIKDLGFEPSDSVKILKTAKPKLGITVKNDIEAYNKYVIDFNADQTAQLKAAQDSTKTTYANDKANIHKTLSEITLRALDDARIAVKDKTSFDAFVNLFKVDKDDDKATFEANSKNMVKPESLGFYPTTDEFKQPGTLKPSATPEEFREYNKQMNKFNQDQAAQLTTAQSLTRTKYADDQVNEYNNLTSTDLTKLGIKRNAIKNSKTNDAFLDLFNKLRAQDLLTEANKIKHNDINNFGYLEGSDFKQLDANIKTLRRMLRKYSNNTYWKRKVEEFDEAKIKKLIKYNITKHNSNYDDDFKNLMENEFGFGAYKGPDGIAWAAPYEDLTGGWNHSGKYGANFSINNNPKSLFVGQDPNSPDWWGKGSTATINKEVTISKTSDFANWNIKMTGACQTTLFDANKNKSPADFVQVNNFIKNLDAYKKNLIKSIDITFKNNSKFISGPNGPVAVFKIDISKIKIVYKDLSDYKTFDKDIFNVVKDLKNQDANAQKDAIEALKQIVDLGFTTTITKVAKPIIGISIKGEVEDYAQYVLTFSDEQTDLLAEAKTDAETKYDELKAKKTLSDTMKTNLEDACKAVVDRKTYDVFLKLYESDKKLVGNKVADLIKKAENEFSNENINRLKYLEDKDFDGENIDTLRSNITSVDTYNKFIVAKDKLVVLDEKREKAAIKAIKALDNKGFASDQKVKDIKADPTVSGTSTKDEVDAYVTYLTAFNADQVTKLATAQTDAQAKYDELKDKKTLSDTMKANLEDARKAILDKKSYNVFLKLYNSDKKLAETSIAILKAKAANEFANTELNKLGYLITDSNNAKYDFAKLDALRTSIVDVDTYKEFIVAKDALIKKDHDAQAKAINDLTALSTLGFKSTIKSVPEPKLGTSTKDKVDAYVTYLTAFNADQVTKLATAQTDAQAKYDELKDKKTLSDTMKANLEDARKAILDKKSYNVFLKLYNSDKKLAETSIAILKAKAVNEFANTELNKLGYLITDSNNAKYDFAKLDALRTSIVDVDTYKEFIVAKDALIKKDHDAQAKAINDLTALSTLGFKSTIKSVPEPKLGTSTKDKVDAYVTYLTAFNADQVTKLATAQTDAQAKYDELKDMKTLSDTMKANLEDARKAILDKKSYNVFLKLYNSDKKLAETSIAILKAKAVNEFANTELNKLGYLITDSNNAKYDFAKLDALRTSIVDVDTYKEFIVAKDALIKKDHDAQAKAINDLTALSTLGFKSTIKSVPEPKLGTSTKDKVDAYVTYLTAFNADQVTKLATAQTDAQAKYDELKDMKTLSDTMKANLEDARKAILDKKSYNVFLKLYNSDKKLAETSIAILKAKAVNEFANTELNKLGYLITDSNNAKYDFAKLDALRTSIVDVDTYKEFIVAKDALIKKDHDAQAKAINDLTALSTLGFKSTIKSVPEPKLGTSTKDKVDAYVTYLTAFNADQVTKLATAQTDAQAKYDELKDMKTLSDTMKANLEDARKAILDKKSYNVFLKLYNSDKKLAETSIAILKAKAVNEFANTELNKLGYLITDSNNAKYDFAKLDALRTSIVDVDTYKEFIVAKDALIKKDHDAQAKAINDLTALSTLGFKSTIKSVPEPKLGTSTKDKVDAYATYLTAFNADQVTKLATAQTDAQAKYDELKDKKTLSDTMKANLEDARKAILDKKSYNVFLKLYNSDKKLAETSIAILKAKAVNEFANTELNKLGYLITDSNNAKYDFAKLDALRTSIVDVDTYKEFIVAKDALIKKDHDAQAKAINDLTALSTLGFKSTIKSVPKPKLGTSTKDKVDAYVTYLTAFNADQVTKLATAQTDAQAKYDELKDKKTLSDTMKANLEDARKAILDKKSYNVFLKLYNSDKKLAETSIAILKAKAANEFANTELNKLGYLITDSNNAKYDFAKLDALRTSIVDVDTYKEFIVAKDALIKKDHDAQAKAINDLTALSTLGFKSTIKSVPEPKLGTSTKDKVDAYVTYLTAFNADQVTKLATAQTDAQAKYDELKDKKTLSDTMKANLEDARKAILDKKSYNVFLKLYNSDKKLAETSIAILKAKAANEFANTELNKLGYLITDSNNAKYDFAKLDALRTSIVDVDTYKEFIVAKDALIKKDHDAQAKAINDLTALSTLGFKSTIKSVPKPKLGISIKTNIDAYVDYVKAFNVEQEKSSTNASDEVNGAKYTNAVANKYGTIKDDMAALDTARETFNKLKNKANYDAFITLFKADQARDLVNHKADIKNQIKEIDLGFNPTKGSEKPVPYVLDKQTATKDDYKKFNDQMTKFNSDQTRQLEHAQTLAKDKYTNVYANENKTLETADLTKLDDARDKIKTKATYDTFLNLFRVLKAKDFSNKIINRFGYLSTSDVTDIDSLRKAVKDNPGETSYKAFIARKDELIIKDAKAQADAINDLKPLSTLGFKSTIKSVPKPKLGISIKTNIDAYVDYVKVFNTEQNTSSTNASDEVNGAKYTNAVANKYGTIKDDMAALDTARETFNKLKNKANYDAFITLFKADQARDLINHNADIKNQIKEIDLGFNPTKGSEKPVPYVLDKQTATKDDYKKFNDQMTKFNSDQTRQLEHAQTLAKDKYTNVYANENKTLETADLTKLDDARDKIKTKATYDTFLNLFRVLKAKDFSNKIINRFGYLSTSDVTDIDSLRKAVKDNPGETSYKAFIARKDELIIKDAKAQADAINDLKPLSTLGFKSTIKSVPKPKLGISIKTNIDAYVDYVKAFNVEQEKSSTNASDEVNGAKYTNAVANKYGTIKDDMAALDTARETFNKLKNKANYDAFITLFKADQARDLVNHKADIKNQIKEIDLGFNPTKGSEKPVPYVLDKQTATKDDYKKFNDQMTKFNSDQTRQLEHAQTLAKDKYTNVYANENKTLETADLTKLDDARDKIKTKATYDTFLNLFRVLKAKDFSNKIINRFGYLSTSDVTDIDSLRKAVKDNPGETSYKAFIARKDELIIKDAKAQADAINDLKPLSTLGFKSTIKSVPKPKLGISIKTNIDAYVDYVKVFNTEQNTSSTNASDEVNGAKYTNAVANKYGTIKDDMAALDTARETFNKLKNKANYDAFITLFKADQARDLVNHKADIKNQIKEIDLGFNPTKGSEKPVPYVLDKQTATKDDYKKFNDQMTKFNSDQTRQLEHAQTLAKDKYTNVYANENKTLETADLTKLDDDRDKIKTKATYDTFLNLFRVLKAKDFSDKIINRFGYLSTSDVTDIDSLRKAVKDNPGEASYKAFIARKDELIIKDAKAQADAINDLKPLSTLGFKSTIKSVPKPKLGISIKTNIDAYVDYVKVFNTEQNTSSTNASDEVNGAKYTNAVANKYGTIKDDMAALDTARETFNKLKNKANYDAFITLFKADQARDLINHNADIKNQIKEIDLGFNPTKGFEKPVPYVLDKQTATKDDYKKFNDQMTKFNSDQTRQLEHAQTLAKDKYTNVYANENKTLETADLTKLDDDRDKIKTKATYDTFLNLFRVLKAKDFSNKIINRFGYLSTSDVTDIDSLRKAVKDNPGEASYKAFIARKDELIIKDAKAQADAINDLKPLSTLGFKSTIKSVPKPKLGISIKTNIDAYVDYVKVFNTEQNTSSTNASDEVNGAKYTNAVANKYGTIKDDMAALDTARETFNKLKNKANYDAFITLFKADQARDLINHNADIKNQIKEIDLGFNPTKGFEKPVPYVLDKQTATKDDYKKFNDQMTKFNSDQTRQLEHAQTLAKDKYTNVYANENKTLETADLTKLDDDRDKIKTKANYDTFLNLFRVLKAKDFSDKIINRFGYLSTSDVTDIDSLRKAVKDNPGETSYKTFIARKDELIIKDAKAQADAINDLKPLSTLGFKSTIKSVPKPKLGISIKTNIDAYVDYVKAFNANQAAQLKAAKDSTTTTYTNDKANVHKTLSQIVLKVLDDARTDVKDKASFDVFVKLFKADKADDKATYDANKNSLVEVKDLGFDSTTEEFKQPDSLKENAIPEEYKKYNKQMSKFNQDQAAQLKTAQDLAKDQYTNAKANENGNLDKVADLGPLDVARIAIADKVTYDTFLNLFRVLKAKDFSDKIINRFGYLSTSDVTDIDSLRKAVKDNPGETSYKAFIAKKDALILKDKNAQINAIDSLTSTPLSTLGFKSTIKSVPEPKLGISTKTEIDAYVDYVKAFNANQAAQLKAAKDSTTTTYTNDKANVHKTLSQFVLKALDDTRIAVKDKATFDAFVNLFKVDKADDQATYDANNNSLVEVKDLGFDPTTEEFKQPDSLGKNAIPEEYKKYNKQMSKFNQDQAAQLKTAQDLAKDQYTNVKANENGNLDKVADLDPLDVARIAIADKDSNDTFLNLFRVLKAKDFSDKIINKFGYLSKDSDLKGINALRADVKDKDTYDKFIAQKDVLIKKDQDAQAKATKGLIALNTLGFESSENVKKLKTNVPKKGVSTKTDIDTYIAYASAFNQEQNDSLKNAIEEAKTTYTNDKANIHKTLSETILTNLDTVRTAIKDKTTFEVFKKLFIFDQDSDAKNFEDVQNRIVKANDLGFVSPAGFEKPETLKGDATAEKYKVYNLQMNKFNQDQDNQLSTAITLSTSKYADENVNEYKHLDKELKDLDDLRKAIKNKASNDDFVAMFKKLRGQDLKVEVTINFSDAKINALGYLKSKDINNKVKGNDDFTKIDTLREKVKDESTYKIFIKERDRLVALDKQRQENAISSLGKLKDLGFPSRKPKVASPIINISKKEDVDKYVQYIIDFNKEQKDLLKIAKTLATTKYAINELGENQHQASTDAKTKLVSVRRKIVNKKTFDIFVAKFQALRLVNLKATVLDFGKKEINALGYLGDKDFHDSNIKQLGNDVKDESTYKIFIKEKDRLVTLDRKRQIAAIKSLIKSSKKLGFTSTIKLVDPIEKGISTKKQVEAYAKYMKAYSAEQTKKLRKVQNDAATIYTNEKVNEHGHLEAKNLTNLDNLRTQIKTKDSYDRFIDKFNELKLLDDRLEVSNKFTDEIINKNKKLTDGELEILAQVRENIGQKGGYKLLKNVSEMLKNIGEERERSGTLGKFKILKVIDPDGENVPNPDELGEKPTPMQIMEYNNRVATYNERQRLIKQQAIKEMKNRVAQLKANSQPVIPFSQEENILLDDKEKKINLLVNLATITKAVDDYEHEYNQLLDKKLKKLKGFVKDAKKVNKIINFGFIDKDAPKLPTLSSEGSLTKGKLDDYKTAVSKFNYYQQAKKIEAQKKLKTFVVDEEHVNKEKIDELNKAKKEIEDASNSDRYAQLYNNFVEQYANSAGGILADSKTKNLLKIAIPSVSGLLIVFLVGIIFKQKRSKKNGNNFGGKTSTVGDGEIEDWGDGEVEEWGDDGLDGWE